MNNINDNETINNFSGEKKSGKKGIIGVVIALVLVLAAGVTAFAAKDKIMNIFQKNVASPTDYYHSVEKKEFDNALKDYMTLYKETYDMIQADSQNGSAAVKVEVTDDISGMLSTIHPILGQLKSAQISMDAAYGKDELSLNLDAQLNNADIISGNAYINTTTSEMYAQLPDISSSYLNLSSAISEENFASLSEVLSLARSIYQETYPSPEVFEKTAKGYVEMCIEAVKTVTKDTKTIKANGVEQKATALSAKMSGTEVYNLLMALFNKLENDETLMKFFEEYLKFANSTFTEGELSYLTIEDFKIALADAKVSLESSKEEFESYERLLTMVVYVNDDGEIISREITLDNYTKDDEYSETYTISSLKAVSQNKMGHEILVKENDEVLVEIKGSGSASITEFAGEYVLSVPSEDITVTAKIDNCNTSKLLAGEYKCDVTITTNYSALSTYELKLSIDTAVKNMITKIEVAGNGMKFGSVTISSNVSDKGASYKPADNATVISLDDTMALYSYIADFNLQDFVNKKATAAGISITYEELAELFSAIGGLSSDDEYNIDDYDFGDDDLSDDDLDLDDYDLESEDFSDEDFSDEDFSDDDLNLEDFDLDDIDWE